MAVKLPPPAASHPPEFSLPPTAHPYYRRVVRTTGGWVSSNRQKPTVFAEHRHFWLELVVFFDGAACVLRWRQPNGHLTEVPLRNGHVWIVPPGMNHSVDWQNEGHLLTFFLEAAWVQNLRQAPICHVSVEPLDRYVETEPMIGDMGAFFCRQTEPTSLAAESAMANMAPALASQLLTTHYAPCQFRHPQQWQLSRTALADVRTFIETHLADDLSLPTLAKVAGLSPNYFGQLFRAATGIPPIVFVIGSRVRRAKQLLGTGRHSAAEVAQLTGFSDQHQMAYHFRQCSDRPPQAFKPIRGREISRKFQGIHQAAIGHFR